jgi:predicted Zn-dependent peptidase
MLRIMDRAKALVWVLLTATGLALAGEQNELTSVTLDNGLEVTILPDQSSPLVATQVWYQVGSADEAPGSFGFAHLFEHLMFGDTASHSKHDYAELHHRYGGYENAYTTFDETVYVSEIAAEHHRAVLEMEADRMVNLALTQENLDNEIRIVSEELRLGMENDPFNRIYIAALKAALVDHPYAHPPGGTREDVGAATLAACRQFYQRYYRPGNAHLVVVGAVDPAETLQTVEATFGRLPASQYEAQEVPPLLGWDLPEMVELQDDLPPVEIAMLAYILPPAAEQDRAAMAVLEQLLSGGELDLFADTLVTQRHKSVYARSEWLQLRQGGAAAFSAAYLPYRRRATAFRLMEETIAELGKLAWLDEESLASAKRALLRQELDRAYYLRRQAEAIGKAAWWLGDGQLALSRAEEIEAVSCAQVAATFRQVLVETEPVRVYLRPERVPLLVRLFGWLYPLVNRW